MIVTSIQVGPYICGDGVTGASTPLQSEWADELEKVTADWVNDMGAYAYSIPMKGPRLRAVSFRQMQGLLPRSERLKPILTMGGFLQTSFKFIEFERKYWNDNESPYQYIQPVMT